MAWACAADSVSASIKKVCYVFQAHSGRSFGRNSYALNDWRYSLCTNLISSSNVFQLGLQFIAKLDALLRVPRQLLY